MLEVFLSLHVLTHRGDFHLLKNFTVSRLFAFLGVSHLLLRLCVSLVDLSGLLPRHEDFFCCFPSSISLRFRPPPPTPTIPTPIHKLSTAKTVWSVAYGNSLNCSFRKRNWENIRWKIVFDKSNAQIIDNLWVGGSSDQQQFQSPSSIAFQISPLFSEALFFSWS